MAHFTAECLACHAVVNLMAEQVILRRLNRHPVRWGYRCPECGAHNDQPARSHQVVSMMLNGVQLQHAQSTELTPPTIEGRPIVGPAITEDDVLAFGLALERCGVVE